MADSCEHVWINLRRISSTSVGYLDANCQYCGMHLFVTPEQWDALSEKGRLPHAPPSEGLHRQQQPPYIEDSLLKTVKAGRTLVELSEEIQQQMEIFLVLDRKLIAMMDILNTIDQRLSSIETALTPLATSPVAEGGLHA